MLWNRALRITAIALLAYINLAFPAQPGTGSGSIAGTIQDDKGNPVPSATILAMNLDSGESWKSAADRAGGFSVRGLPPGTYRLTVGHDGYEVYQSDDLKVESGRSIRITVRLKHSTVRREALKR